MEAGMRGIGVKTIAMHVYNMNCTLFSQPDFGEIHAYVQAYLLRNSRSKHSLVERTDKRGRYRLNARGSATARQLILNFQHQQSDADEEQPANPQPADLSLSLFD
jgi:hypothetical protein